VAETLERFRLLVVTGFAMIGLRSGQAAHETLEANTPFR
jgi:hypothetical protein